MSLNLIDWIRIIQKYKFYTSVFWDCGMVEMNNFSSIHAHISLHISLTKSLYPDIRTYLSFPKVGDPRGIVLKFSNSPGKKLQIFFFVFHQLPFLLLKPFTHIIKCSVPSSH